MIEMPSMDIALSEDGRYLIYVTISTSGKSTVYNALDIGYTLASEYKEVVVGPETRILSRFPPNTLHFQYDGEYTEKAISEFLTSVDIPFYFDANGLFLHKGSKDPAATEAAWSFLEYAISGDIIHGPDYSMVDIDAKEVSILEVDQNTRRLFVYHE